MFKLESFGIQRSEGSCSALVRIIRFDMKVCVIMHVSFAFKVLEIFLRMSASGNEVSKEEGVSCS